MKLWDKIRSNARIYKEDIASKGVYWSVIHRLYKIKLCKQWLMPVVDFFKPEYIISGGHKIFIDKKDQVVSGQLLLTKEWEPFQTEIFLKQIKTGDTVLDIGAHIGIYTLLAAQKVGSEGKVYSFEPDPRNFALLEKNVRANGYKNVILVKKAISNMTGKARLSQNTVNSGDNRVVNGKDGSSFPQIDTIRLDDFFEKGKRVDLIKMDIQGFEVKAMSGAKRVFSQNKNLKMISEFWPSGIALSGMKPEDFFKFLTKRKYRLKTIDEAHRRLIPLHNKQMKAVIETDREINFLCIRQSS